MAFGSGAWRRAADLAGGLVLFGVVFFVGMAATLMIGLIGAPGGHSSECVDRCRTHVEVGIGLMNFATLVGAIVVLVLMIWSWWRKRPVSVWPLRWILLLVVVTIVSFVVAISGGG